MTDTRRLRPKYMVYKAKVSESGKNATAIPESGVWATDPNDVNSPFVLMPRKDPAAFIAMLTYASLCEPSLASEIRIWLESIAKADPVYGTQGSRNRIVMRLRDIQEIR